MNRSTFSAWGISLVVACACSSGSDERAPSLNHGGASNAGAGGSQVPGAGDAGAGARAEGGEPNDNENAGRGGGSADGGTAGEGGAAGLEPGVVVVVPPSACSQNADWGSPLALPGVSGTGDERLLSITADELDIVFVRDGTLRRAHRDKASADFDTPSTVTIPADYGVSDGATLSADGKTLLLVATSGQGFAVLTRTSRSAAFGTTADTSAFFGLNARAVQTMEHYTSPVLSPDGKSLIYTGFTPNPTTGDAGVARVYESLWANDTWQMPESISDGFFTGTTAARPLPSGLSADSRTLFYFDEKTSKQAARFRDRPDAPLNVLVDLGDREGAIPNAACDVLYYSSDGNVLTESN
ncbi:MAG: hypothetical protein ABW061_00315 [Polyangiaceae bacterium]